MNYAFTNGKLLDGNRDMQVQTGLCILVKNGLISDIVPDTAGCDGISEGGSAWALHSARPY